MEDRGLASNKTRDAVFEVYMNRLSSAQKSDRCQTVAPLVESAARGFLNARVIGQAEVVVGGEHDDGASIDDDITALLALERHFVFEGLGLLYAVQLAIESVVELLGIHSHLLDVGAGGNEQEFDCFVGADELEALLEVLEWDWLSADYLFEF